MTDLSRRIANATALADAFGRWPSFYDSEVVSISLNREGVAGPEIVATLHVFETTSELSAEGFYRVGHPTRVTFAFEGVEDVDLGGLNDQNMLSDLVLQDISNRQPESLNWQVRFDAYHGLDAVFLCRSIRIDDVAPLEPHQSTRSQSSPLPA